MKTQVICIHGGTVFADKQTYYQYLREKTIDRYYSPDWKDWLATQIDDSVEFFLPDMPNKRNADFLSWTIWFEKYLEFLEEETQVILIGHSLGASFLTKYLSLFELPKRVSQLHLVSLPLYEEELDGEILGSFAPDDSLLEKLERQCDQVFVYHSTDDPVVSFSDAQAFCERVPSAELMQFSDRGHITQETFPELLEKIKNI